MRSWASSGIGVLWDSSQLYLCENRVYTPRSGAISTTLKTGESRYVSISASVVDLVRRWKAEQAEFFKFLGITPSGYVMTAEDGQPMHPDSPTDWLAKFAKRHNLPPIHPHKFRHTQASLLISEAKVSTTLDIYSRVLAKSDEKASDTLDDLIYKKIRKRTTQNKKRRQNPPSPAKVPLHLSETG